MMATLHTFFAMGGFGGYVWSAYGLALIAVIGLWVSAQRRKTQALHELVTKQTAQEEA